MRRLISAIRIGIMAYKKPEIFNEDRFKLLADLWAIIFKVATEDKNMMCHVAYLHPIEGHKQIVSLWAGAGIGANPTKRIEELISENNELKLRISLLVEKNNQQHENT